MILSVRLCVIIMALCGTLTASKRQTVETQSREGTLGKLIQANLYGNRLKRSLFKLGAQAAMKLLESAKFIYTNGFDSVYVKRGGIKRALKDFDAVVDPKSVEILSAKSQNKILKTGEIGTLKLTIRANEQRPTTLTISKHPPRPSISTVDPESVDNIIVYTD